MKRGRDTDETTSSRSTNKRLKNAPLPLPGLPDEMIVEVLARLPSKSIGRFRSLSRSWAATLSSASFVELHLQRANQQAQAGPPRLFFTTAQYRFHAWRCGDPVEQLTLTGTLPLPQLEPDSAVQVLTKPCHGLVLLRRLLGRWPLHGHYVCNPSTGALLLLPDSEIPYKMRERRYQPSTDGNSVGYGLGYNSTIKEHKVVRLFSRTQADGSCITSCEVFSLNVSTHWRPAAEPPPLCTVRPHSRAAVFFNGYLHFLQQEGGCIITFNVHTEAFGSLMSPSRLESVPFELTLLDGCLCLHYGEPLSDGPYIIWRLRCYEEGGQWEQLCCIERQAWPEGDRDLLRSRCVSPLELYRGSNGHKKIMFSTAASVVFVVDIDDDRGGPEILLSAPPMGDDKAIMDSFIETTPPYTVGLLEESLVSAGRKHEEIIFSSPSRKAWSDVLKWLPSRFLVSLTCVCRDWRSVIESDRFIQLHTRHANLGKSPRITLMQAYFGAFYPLDRCGRELPGLHAYMFDRKTSRAVCSKPCQGLIGGSYGDTGGNSLDFICNPATEYYKQLNTYVDGEDTTFLAGRFGLGYDSKTNKHVYARLVYHERNVATRDYRLECFIQLMGSDTWRAISTPPRPVSDIQPAYADGKLCWIVDPSLAKESSRCEILTLDVRTQEFSVLQGPTRCNHDQIRSIIELQGHICILCSDRTTNAIDIWRLEHDSWSARCRIELGEFSSEYSSEETTPLDVDPKDGRVLLSTGRALGYYDYKTRTLETIHRLGHGQDGMKFLPLLFHESLVCENMRHVGRRKYALSS